MLIPLALTQFIASFAGSKRERRDQQHQQTSTRQQTHSIWGRKRCLTRSLTLYGTGAVIAALAPALGIPISRMEIGNRRTPAGGLYVLKRGGHVE